MDKLPYIDADDTLELNSVILLVILSVLGKNRNSKPVLNFEKIQCLFYLIKNPSKINNILLANDRQEIFIESKITYTIESQSINVDILYSRSKLKTIIKNLAIYGFLDVYSDDSNEIRYCSSEKGEVFLKQIGTPYVKTISSIANKIKPLATQSAQKTIKSINKLLAGQI
ncbi:ABC-three component system middle component 4 [Enterobacter kobei]|uniref:ABC-three component system middle component 4 n=1 Tax=Enterobacter kobei TaxID=208224 RepID=UPI003BE89761